MSCHWLDFLYRAVQASGILERTGFQALFTCLISDDCFECEFQINSTSKFHVRNKIRIYFGNLNIPRRSAIKGNLRCFFCGLALIY